MGALYGAVSLLSAFTISGAIKVVLGMCNMYMIILSMAVGVNFKKVKTRHLR